MISSRSFNIIEETKLGIKLMLRRGLKKARISAAFSSLAATVTPAMSSVWCAIAGSIHPAHQQCSAQLALLAPEF